MESASSLLDLSLRDFTDRLAERVPTPGGGSMAAYLAASGAALTAMAFRFTSGAKFAAVEAEMAGRVEQLETLRRRALELVDRDSAAYDVVTAAYKLPKSTDSEKALRTGAVQEGLRGALEVPLETMRVAREALGIAVAGAADINPNLASDCATGSWCLWSAAESAALNVRINAGSIVDAAYKSARLAECERILRACRESAESIRSVAGRLCA
ncbi:MAG: cyclodeaminase/cyclohydrolase family protein [Planctomycetota bacterium]